MDGSRLSPREQQILDEIESSLSQDEHLERELRTLHLSVWAKCAEGMRRRGAAALAVLALTSGRLLVVAIRTSAAVPLAAFAVTCAATLAVGVTGMHGWARRRQRP
ncbi:DUF3040 domain-containing protein [Streptomyces sp. NPDC048324]|uniref:DUF3040 domain-containing protein n=1 Tax=Streptomyces sp. NPDC048324 TaxID=3157205 RepID=UPI00342277B8